MVMMRGTVMDWPKLCGGMCPGKVGSSSVVMVPKTARSTAAAGDTRGRVDQLHLQVRADLGHVVAGEVGAVVAVEGGG